MQLGNFSVSLAVKDIPASRDFYTKLGFEPMGGDIDQNWLILRNGEAIVGLFQGMFEKNLLTFNPGWNANAEALPSFQDVRELRTALEQAGLTVEAHIDAETGPGWISLNDPDGPRSTDATQCSPGSADRRPDRLSSARERQDARSLQDPVVGGPGLLPTFGAHFHRRCVDLGTSSL